MRSRGMSWRNIFCALTPDLLAIAKDKNDNTMIDKIPLLEVQAVLFDGQVVGDEKKAHGRWLRLIYVRHSSAGLALSICRTRHSCTALNLLAFVSAIVHARWTRSKSMTQGRSKSPDASPDAGKLSHFGIDLCWTRNAI